MHGTKVLAFGPRATFSREKIKTTIIYFSHSGNIKLHDIIHNPKHPQIERPSKQARNYFLNTFPALIPIEQL